MATPIEIQNHPSKSLDSGTYTAPVIVTKSDSTDPSDSSSINDSKDNLGKKMVDDFLGRNQDEYLPPTRFQPFVELNWNLSVVGGIPDGVSTTIPDTTTNGVYVANLNGLTTGYSNNPEITLGFEYRNWDIANSPEKQARHIYKQMGPTLGVQTQLSRYTLSDYSYNIYLNPAYVEYELNRNSYEMAAAAYSGDYASIQNTLSHMFDNFNLNQTVYGEETTTDRDVWRTQLEGHLGCGSAVYHAQSPIGLFEHFDIGVSGTMTTLGKDFFLGVGAYSDAGVLRIGRNPRLDLGAEGFIRYMTKPISSESYMIETGVGLNAKMNFDLRKKKSQ